MMLLLAAFLQCLLSATARSPECKNSDTHTVHSMSKRNIWGDIKPTKTKVNDCDKGQGLSDDKTTCVNCPPGTYGKNDECKECKIGEFNDMTKQTECTGCHDAKGTITTGSRDVSDCVDICPLGATTIHSQYTVDNKAVADGGNVEEGTMVTLLCESDYTFKGADKYEESCASKRAVLKNECFKVTIEGAPSSDLYEFTGSEAILTCYGFSSFKPHLISYTKTDGESFQIVDKDAGQDNYDPNTDRDMARFVVTSAIGSQGIFACTMQVYDGITEVETSINTANIFLFEYEDAVITPSPTVYVGTDVTISAGVTDLPGLMPGLLPGYTWSWKKGNVVYNNFYSIDKTENTKNYKLSKAGITSAAFGDTGVYTISLAITDERGMEKLTKDSTATLTVRGFSSQPADENGLTTVRRAEGSHVVLTCTFTGGLESDESIKWMKADKTTNYEKAGEIIVASTKVSNTETRSTIRFDSWPTFHNAEAYCMIFKSDVWQFSSEPVKMYSVAPVWNDVVRKVKTDLDLETSTLQIKTNTPFGSERSIYVQLLTEGPHEEEAGEIGIGFDSASGEYRLGKCREWTDFASTPGTGKDMLWTITKTGELTKPRIVITCDGVEVVNVLISDTTCTDNDWTNTWATYWNKDVAKIKFQGLPASGWSYSIGNEERKTVMEQ